MGGRLVKLVGTGVGVAAEYSQHRKAQKELRRESDTLQAQDNAVAGPSTPWSINSRVPTPPNAAPPAYDYAFAGPSSRQILATGGPALGDKKSHHESDDDDDYFTPEDEEAVWELDEAQLSDEPPSYEQSQNGFVDENVLVREVLQTNATKSRLTPTMRQPLPMPVIIPQRRPGSKSRGFVRAYAPLLGECSGIDEATFLAFLKNFYKSSKAHPAFNIIQVAAGIAGFAPSAIAMAVSTAVQVGAKAGAEIDRRRRINGFLDKMNEVLFKPAGVFAMIVKYSRDTDKDSTLARFGISSARIDLDTNQAIARYDVSGGQGMRSTRDRLRIASGETQGAAMLPESCPLVFPDLDRELAENGTEGFKGRTRDFGKFLGNYMDKRAQMKYAQNDPSSGLAMAPTAYAYKSKFADPNHPMFNGGLVGIVSGGHVTRDRGQERSRRRSRDRSRDRDDGRRRRRGGPISGVIGLVGAAVDANRGKQLDTSPSFSQGYGAQHPGPREPPYMGQQREMPIRGSREDYYGPDYQDGRADSSYRPASHGGRRDRRERGGLRKLMKENVLYLMIVNMPSEQELAQARRALGGR